jgi:nucleoid-associated protein YgaU
MATNNSNTIGKTKRSTDEIIADSISRQDNWLARRRNFTRRFLKSMNAQENEPAQEIPHRKAQISLLREYWFPIMCAIVVLFVAVWAIFVRPSPDQQVVVFDTSAQTEPAAKPAQVKQVDVPTFDIVRIKPDGMVVVAGRWKPNTNLSVLINNKIVATERTNQDGEFAYASGKGLKAGNYTISLMGLEPETKSADKVFLYISEAGYKNSISLLMTNDGSRILQSPTLIKDGDLIVSKIDYLDTGRIVITGDALPRLRVSLSMNDKYLGFARVSDYRHFGLGADVGELVPGQKYDMTLRLHDGDGETIATVHHSFIMPQMTGDNDTFYTVRRGDCLWIIARNFLRRGVLFSIIAERNNIKNPNLIFPKQILQIPMK